VLIGFSKFLIKRCFVVQNLLLIFRFSLIEVLIVLLIRLKLNRVCWRMTPTSLIISGDVIVPYFELLHLILIIFRQGRLLLNYGIETVKSYLRNRSLRLIFVLLNWAYYFTVLGTRCHGNHLVVWAEVMFKMIQLMSNIFTIFLLKVINNFICRPTSGWLRWQLYININKIIVTTKII
jgi:hypothetical protein